MRRLVVVGAAVVAATVAPAATASAHPLGNFTINHYDGLVITPTKLVDHVVVDTAEIPTAQARHAVDADGDGAVSPAEARVYAGRQCGAVARSVAVTVGGRSVPLTVASAAFGYRPGAAGLQTSRLECALSGAVTVSSRTTLVVADGFDADRIGWHEITAVGAGVRLVAAAVPARSVSDELRHYPNDLLSSPLDVRTARLDVLPGPGPSTVSRNLAHVPVAGPVARLVGRLDRSLGVLAADRRLGLGAAVLALLVALLLGAAHAALPGHGKTVMAAYLAGRRGTRRDALVVGATVTVTHTAGVLLLGLALSLSSTLAGDRLTNELGVVSGGLVVVVGVGLLMNALRRGHDHDHHDHDHHDHDHDHPHPHPHARPHPRQGRAALVGMGVAGGLVPSPTALVVLLGAVALGRAAFGVVLVLVYGLGMAATLTAAGLLLVGAVDRLGRDGRLARLTGRLSGLAPTMTALVVTAVGVTLAARSVVTL